MSKVELPAPPETAPAERQPAPSRRAAAGGMPLWFKGLAPLVLLAALVALFLRVGPVGVFRQSFPPVEELTIERIRLPEHGVMEVQVVNGGPGAGYRRPGDGGRRQLGASGEWKPHDRAAGAAHHHHSLSLGRRRAAHGRTGDQHRAHLHRARLPVATLSPAVDARYLTTFALLGVYAGVIPVFIGLLWLPFVRAVSRRWIDFFLSLTMGLLVFLGVDALVEAVETSALVAGAFQGSALVLLGLLGTPLILAALGHWRGGQRGERTPLQVAGPDRAWASGSTTWAKAWPSAPRTPPVR